MKIAITIFVVILVVTAYTVGTIKGFDRGAEWAIYQAQIEAREAGAPSYVTLDEEGFKVVIKQKKGTFTKARKDAEKANFKYAMVYDQTSGHGGTP